MSTLAVGKPGRMKRLLANFGMLASGRTLSAVFSLCAITIAARQLGAESFGVVVMVHAAALLIRQLCTLKTGDALIRFGVPLAEDGRVAELKGLLRRFLGLDLAASAAGAIVGAVLLAAFAPQLGLPEPMRAVAWVYVPVLLVSVTSAAKGALRLLDRFGALSAQLAVGAMTKLAVVLALPLTPLATDARAYLAAWALSLLVEQAYAWWRAFRSYRSHFGETRAQTPALDAPEVRGFLFTVYWQSTLDAAPKQLATLLAGTLLGSAAAGLFAFARELAAVLAKPVTILRQVVFPDLARLWRDDVPRFVNVIWRTGALTAGVGAAVVLVAAVGGERLLRLLAGDEFAGAAALLALLLAAASIDLAGAALRPAGYVMGRARMLLGVQIAATVVYVAAFLGLVWLLGLMGVGLAAVAASLVSVGGSAWLVIEGLRARRALAP